MENWSETEEYQSGKSPWINCITEHWDGIRWDEIGKDEIGKDEFMMLCRQMNGWVDKRYKLIYYDNITASNYYAVSVMYIFYIKAVYLYITLYSTQVILIFTFAMPIQKKELLFGVVKQMCVLQTDQIVQLIIFVNIQV